MKDIKEILDASSKQSFKVPDGYFETFEKRLLEKIQGEEKAVKENKNFMIYLKPYFTLAASIAGVALVTYLVLQTLVPGSMIGENQNYSIELIDETGIILDESVIAESYSKIASDEYADWEEDAMTYLASNEVDLLLLIEQ